MDGWTVVRVFGRPAEAAMCRSALEANGIECFLGNEIAMSFAFGETVGGVDVKVRESDVERALAIIDGENSGEDTEA